MQLIIINGPCGIGKSTVAQQLHEIIPLSFLLDIDAQARFISHYRENKDERIEMSVAVASAIIEVCCKLDRSVIVDKMTFSPEILNTYRALGEKYGAKIVEIILWAPKAVVMTRANTRGWREGGLLTPEKCERFWEEIDRLKDHRPQATVIDVGNLNEKEVLQKVQLVVASGSV